MKNGFLLLLTVLIVSVILSLSLSVGNTVLNQIKLSGTGRESQIAFYAADAGAECALYWDLKQNAFSTTTTSSITCVNGNFTVGGSGASNFVLNFDNNSCAKVKVEKSWNAATNSELTAIESLGRDKTGNPAQCSGTGRALERGIKLNY